jgi:hypothetical protein
MIMAEPKDKTQDDYRRSFPRPWGDVFGDSDPDPDLFADQPQAPAENSTAAKHANRVEQRRKDAAKARAQFAAQLRKEQEEREQDPLRGVPTAEIIARAAIRQPAQDTRPPKKGTRAAAEDR